MQKDRMRNVDTYIARYRRHWLWQKAVATLACVVVFVTTYALILPAITMEKYDCGLAEHTHTEACYAKEAVAYQKLACMLESLNLHEHGTDCYDENGALVCGQVNFVLHEHNATCYGENGELLCSLPEIKGHTHDEACYDDAGNIICEQEEILPHEHDGSCYDEQGTLVCGKLEVLEHVHSEDCFETAVLDTDELTCTIPEGDGAHTHTAGCYDEAGELTCEQEESEGHQHSAQCYGTWELTCGEAEHIHTDDCATVQIPEETPAPTETPDLTEDEPVLTEVPDQIEESPAPTTDLLSGVALNLESHFENDYISAVFHIEGTVTLSEGCTAETETLTEADQATPETAAEDPDRKMETAPPELTPVLTVTELSEDRETYQRIADAAQNDDLIDLSVLQIEAYCNDQKLDISGCTITAEVTPTVQLMETLQTTCLQMEEDSAPEAEMGILLAALEPDGVTEQSSTFVTPDTTNVPVLMACVGDDGIMTVEISRAANPKFTVQYYAYLDAVASDGDAQLDTIIERGGNLPTNGTTPETKLIGLTRVENGKYQVTTESSLTEVYKSLGYQYITAPNLTYFNRLAGNEDYELIKVWVLKEGGDANSTDVENWDIYDADAIHFTNRKPSEDEGTVQITDGTVIRLVFDTVESSYTNQVNFFDYDITNDGLNTTAQGINSAENYAANGAKLAFGNANTGTGLKDESWNGNTLNRYNSASYKGCTFGLVTGLVDSRLQYAPGVVAPSLFNDEDAAGKTAYVDGQYTLTFNQKGDTYILSAVDGTDAAGLEYFNHPAWPNQVHETIWTNNFWPMDGVHNKDPHTGDYNNRGTFNGVDGEDNYPASDDGQNHNSMFGMQYSVSFTLTPDYIGPLEYYFFGDDDMWVFLDGKLVCDIGGVHSSVGAYVDLWDYLDRDTDGDDHTLSFYYTERGLSGSTCYMRFTLPSVASATPGQNTGSLKIQKNVVGATASNEEFQFKLTLYDQNGNPLRDAYAYTQYDANGELLNQDIIDPEDGVFALKAGEYLIVHYLPYGTRYTITENNLPYYSVAATVDGGAPTEGNTAAGEIAADKSNTVIFTNTAKPMLPETGGPGTTLYTAGGLFAVICAGMLLFYKNKKRRKEEQ